MNVKLRKKTRAEHLQDIINMYLKETGFAVIDMKEVAAWAVRNGHYEAAPGNTIKQCAHELARAARAEYYTDPQGRTVRKKHAIRQDQGFLWADIETAPPTHVRMSLQQRRMYIVGDCKQLKTDLDSYNDNNVHGAQIQMSFDFTEDLRELEMPQEYPARKPE
jgi:hypothetical protein